MKKLFISIIMLDNFSLIGLNAAILEDFNDNASPTVQRLLDQDQLNVIDSDYLKNDVSKGTKEIQTSVVLDTQTDTASNLLLPLTQAEQSKWASSVDTGFKASESRRIGEVDYFLPIIQNERSLLFLDLRTNFDNLSQQEGNFGLGYRAMQDNGWNLGSYTFFDRRRSIEGNYFSQITTGLEVLGENFDARANAYIPIGNKTKEVENSTKVDLSSGSIQILSGIEKAYHGADVELGWRVPIFDANENTEIRVYGGGYWFDAESSESITGPRAALNSAYTTQSLFYLDLASLLVVKCNMMMLVAANIFLV